MLIRPQQALPWARNNSKLLIFNNVCKIQGLQASLSDLYQEKEDNPYIFFLFYIFPRPSYLTSCRGSKLALLHRVKERKTPSLSAQASFAPFSLKVAWSGKSLIATVSFLREGSFSKLLFHHSLNYCETCLYTVMFSHVSMFIKVDLLKILERQVFRGLVVSCRPLLPLTTIFSLPIVLKQGE